MRRRLPGRATIVLMKNLDFALVTYRDLPQLDPDDQLLLNELQQRGYTCQPVVWNENFDWSSTHNAVIRSTWDYHLHFEKFTDWINDASDKTQLWNSAGLMRWNSHKTYLRDLQEQEIPIVPTRWVNQSDTADLREIMAAEGWTEAIVKPTVGLATFGVKRVSSEPRSLKAGQEHLDSLSRSSQVMIQKYMPSVTTYGERALTFFGKQFSHAVSKSAFQELAHAGHAGEKAVEATAQEVFAAVRVLDCLPQVPLYARVDFAPDEAGVPRLMELELIEPSLFLSFSAGAAAKFADVLERYCST